MHAHRIPPGTAAVMRCCQAVVCVILLNSSPASANPGPIRVGGAIRANYVFGSYSEDGPLARRSAGIGTIELDTFRLNADIDHRKLTGRVEYRWYEGYSMIHTAWLGYEVGGGTLRAGIVRVPFGPGPYGASNSWFFDQHYYVGLADDMDLGLRWTRPHGDWTLDAAWYAGAEPQTHGDSLMSSRYSYDVVRWNETADAAGVVAWGAGPNGFEERGQLNFRAIRSWDGRTDAGFSLQYGRLSGRDGENETEGATHHALSGHLKHVLGDFTVYSQLSYYAYDLPADTPWGTGELIPMGGYDFAWPIAARAWVPALSLRYGGIPASGGGLVEAVVPYFEVSSIVKTVAEYNDSTLVMLGTSLTLRNGLVVTNDLAISNGSYWVGDRGDDYSSLRSVGDFGVNGNDRWNFRFNVNIAYYF